MKKKNFFHCHIDVVFIKSESHFSFAFIFRYVFHFLFARFALTTVLEHGKIRYIDSNISWEIRKSYGSAMSRSNFSRLKTLQYLGAVSFHKNFIVLEISPEFLLRSAYTCYKFIDIYSSQVFYSMCRQGELFRYIFSVAYFLKNHCAF